MLKNLKFKRMLIQLQFVLFWIQWGLLGTSGPTGLTFANVKIKNEKVVKIKKEVTD